VTQNANRNHGEQAGVRDPFAPPQRAPRFDSEGATLMAPGTPAEVTSASAHPVAGTKVRAGSLVVVSAGVMAVNHVTVEAQGWIKYADKVFCWGVDPVTERWIASLNRNIQSLESAKALGIQALEFVRAGLTVCAVHADGTATWREDIRKCRAEGLRAVIVPGVSTEDCLFSDLGIDPRRDGVQIYGATEFLTQLRVPVVSAGLVLRLAGCTGDPTFGACHPSLVEVLAGQYGREHEAILYEPARYAICEPLIRRCRIGDLAHAAVTAHTSLFVPPKEERPGDCEAPRRRTGERSG
jgi:hypothetical protein